MSRDHDSSDVGVTLTTYSLSSPPLAGERGYVLCFEGDSSRVFDLPGAGEVVIGRAPDVDLQLDDSSVSRRHAQLLITGQQVRLTDLGSRHGTRVNGEPVRALRQLISSDVITVGGVTLVFHRASRPSAIRSFLDAGQLRQRLEEEIERALHYQRQAALALFELAGDPGPGDDPGRPATSSLRAERVALDRAGISAALAGRVRMIDVAAFVGARQLAVLMPEREHAAALAAAGRMVEALGERVPTVRAGLASCPQDGCDADTLLSSARVAAEAAQPGAVATPSAAAATTEIGDRTIVIVDPAMRRVYDLIEKLAPSDLPILVVGDTGTGKEIAATAIHERSRRKDGPLVPINCAALPENLVESELFGHEKGAFTGAGATKQGLFERASGGTVFLDELGELPPAVQAKLLRALETQRIMRVGSVEERAIDVRLVAATNRDLQAQIADGRFREDLYFRLSAARIVLPRLHDRPREIPVLAQTLLAAACRRMDREPLAIAPAAMHRLFAYPWPGNVRELKNAMDYAAATAAMGDADIDVWHLPAEIAEPAVPTPLDAIDPADPASPAHPAGPSDRTYPPDPAEKSASRFEPDRPAPGASPAPDAQVAFRPISDEVRELERTRMIQALDAARGRQNRAAELISMPLRTFVTKLKRYDIPTGRRKTDD